MAAETEPLQRYAAKRDFKRTPEPKGVRAKKSKALSFVVQKHWATRLHYDFRLELDGVLLSWAVPKGPTYDPKEKRMAIHVEDHPVSYGGFEGTIPPKQYGAGTVIVWDRGTWEPVGDPHEGMASGKLVFKLHGEKLAGLWELVRIAKPGDKQEPWMLFKKRDEWARPLVEYDVIAALPDSVIEKPLGLVEEREPRGIRVAAAAPAAPRALEPSELPGAVQAELPAKLTPQLATLATSVPAGQWTYEVKFDGYRLLARVDAKGQVRLITRNGNDWTAKLMPLAAAVQALDVRSAWLDGEIVVLDDDGTPSFNALQNAFDTSRTGNIDYFLFDVPYLDGWDLRQVPLHTRRALLKQLVEAKGSDGIRYSADFQADAASMLETARALKLEGIIAKRTDAPYVTQRSTSWLKLKCQERQEFVIGGYTDRAGSTTEVGSLLLGYYDDFGMLKYAGNVGTGWDAATAADLRKRLAKLEVAEPAFDVAAEELKPGRWGRRSAGGEHWVKPQLVAEVSFVEWTPEGRIRASSFRGLRTDKPPRSITRESARAAPAVAPGAARKVGSVKVSNPDRVIDASTGLKKLDLVRYYESVAERLAAASEGAPGRVRARPRRHRRAAFFPEARRQAQHPRPARARPGDVARPPGDARGAERRGDRQRGADERDRVPHLELDDEGDRQARPHRLRPRPRRRRALGAGAGSRAADAHDAQRAGPRQLAEDERRQGLARVRAARAEARLRHGEGLRAGGRAAPREDDPVALRREERRREPGRPHLRRLPAQRPRRDDGRGVLGARAPGARRVDAGVVGATAVAEERLAMVDRDGARIPVVRKGRPVGRLLEVEADAGDAR